MTKRIRSLLAILLSILFVSTVAISLTQSQTQNNPNVNDEANACLPGGSMYDQCNRDVNDDGVVDQLDIDYLWRCGWYTIRVEYGIYDASVLEDKCLTVQVTPVPTTETPDDDDDNNNSQPSATEEVEESDSNLEDENGFGDGLGDLFG